MQVFSVEKMVLYAKSSGSFYGPRVLTDIFYKITEQKRWSGQREHEN